ncbi:MAG: PTS sugar transporter subunit IIA [Mycoplasmatales bacterium]|nr:PTS sugar transporter subunit IIA [Mycoplasmatales bacterium]
MSLLDSLIENDSINLNLYAKDWKEAIELSIKPLLESGSVEKRYIDAVIDVTSKYGPYYILSEKLAMPHARPEDGALKNAFSLITLKEPIVFEGDDRKISVLIALSATSSEIHVSSALPQIAELFSDSDVVDNIEKAKNKNEVIDIIKKVLGGKDA